MNVTENGVNTVLVVDEVKVKRGQGRPRTKMTLKRVVLLDGKPVGRGRPEKDSKGERTVVFIPVNEDFDVAKHGTGKKYLAGLAQYKLPIKRVDLNKYQKMVNATASPVEAPVVDVSVTVEAPVAVSETASV